MPPTRAILSEQSSITRTELGLPLCRSFDAKGCNGIDLVWQPWKANADNFEYELRHGAIPRKPGVVRLRGYTNHANMGIYRNAVVQFEQGLVSAPDITNHPWH